MKCVLSLSDSLLGEMSVPFDLVKKQPKGQQTFALMTKDTVTGSLTTDVRASPRPYLPLIPADTVQSHIYVPGVFIWTTFKG